MYYYCYSDGLKKINMISKIFKSFNAFTSHIFGWCLLPITGKKKKIQKGMKTEPISSLYSKRPTGERNFKEPYPSGGMKKCEEDQNDNWVHYLSSLT